MKIFFNERDKKINKITWMLMAKNVIWISFNSILRLLWAYDMNFSKINGKNENLHSQNTQILKDHWMIKTIK